MTNHSFPSPHNPNNSNLPFGQPHFPKDEGQSFGAQQGNAPNSPPPTVVPKLKTGLLAVEPGAFSRCLNRDTYIQLTNRTSFWFHPTYIDYYSTSGYKWTGYTWIAWGTDLDRIVSFQCT